VNAISVRISRTGDGGDIPVPVYATPGSAGMDVCAALTEPLVLRPGDTALVPSGFRIELPPGYEAQIRPRSGLAINHSVVILNSPGTIDSDYRGEVKVIMANLGKKDFMIRRGDRVAQLVVARYVRVQWDESSTINHTQRGSGGFGHTGV